MLARRQRLPDAQKIPFPYPSRGARSRNHRAVHPYQCGQLPIVATRRRARRRSPLGRQWAQQARDGGCRFPGCSHRRFVDAHHIEHWADGGETSIDNLVLLCRRHHRLVHEGGFGLNRVADGCIRFTRPDRRAINDHPRLPGGTIEALRCGNQQAGQAIDVSLWIIPGDDLDYGIAIGGLLSLQQKRPPP
jgi:hypothetical protein